MSQVECIARGLTQKKAGFPCSGLNLGSCFMSQHEGKSDCFFELQREAGVCSRVTAAVDIKNFRLYSDVGAPI